MNRSLTPVPDHQPSAAAGTDLGREHVLRLGRLCAAVVTAGALCLGGTGAAEAAGAHHAGANASIKHVTKHVTKHTAKHVTKHAKRGKARSWVATGKHVTVTADGSATRSMVTDPTGDVTARGSLLSALKGAGRHRASTTSTLSGDADLTQATLTREGDDVEITVDTSAEFTGQQGLSLGGLVDVSASEAYHLAVYAAGGATVYSATATATGDGQLAAGSAATADGDGSVTFTVPVAALPRDAQLHVELSTDLGVTASALGGAASTSLSGHLGDTLDFGYRTGS